MTPRITFLTHAGLAIEAGGEVLLLDPWFDGDVFNQAWSLLVKPDVEAIDFPRVRHVWASHEHPDHLSFATLKEIRRRCVGPLRFYYRRQPNPNVREAVAALGYEVVELDQEQWTELNPRLSIKSYQAGADSTLVIRAEDKVIIDQNDCLLGLDQAQAIVAEHPAIDAWFFQFSLAGYYANADDRGGLAAAKAGHLKLIAAYSQVLRPRIFVPFASFITFCKQANAYLNEWAITPEEVVRGFPDLKIQILYNGDELFWEGWSERNDANLVKWRTAFTAPRVPKASARVEDEALLTAGRALLAKLTPASALLVPGSCRFALMESDRDFILDFRRRRCEVAPRRPGVVPAGALPAEELLFFMKFPWGADTLNVTACFQIRRAFGWHWAMGFRHALYEFGGTPPLRARARIAAAALRRAAWQAKRRLRSLAD